MTERTLTPHEAAMSYIANRSMGIDISKISAMYATNQGRVSEAITAVEWAVEHLKEAYAIAIEAKQRDDAPQS